MTVGKEAHELSVRRPEREGSAVGAVEFPGFQVIEGLHPDGVPFFLVAGGDPLTQAAGKGKDSQVVFLEFDPVSSDSGRFVVISDARFSAVIASPPTSAHDDADTPGSEP